MGTQEKKRIKRIKQYVIHRDGAICCYCDKVLSDDAITMEHIVPDSKRGTFNATNLTISCSKCNNKRGNQPFFEYCQQFNWPPDKLIKYKKLYFSNLKIKVLNLAKEEHLKDDSVIPQDLIKKACKTLKIKNMDFSFYEKRYFFDIKFDEIAERKKIKYCFELLIRLIEADSE